MTKLRNGFFNFFSFILQLLLSKSQIHTKSACKLVELTTDYHGVHKFLFLGSDLYNQQMICIKRKPKI